MSNPPFRGWQKSLSFIFYDKTKLFLWVLPYEQYREMKRPNTEFQILIYTLNNLTCKHFAVTGAITRTCVYSL